MSSVRQMTVLEWAEGYFALPPEQRPGILDDRLLLELRKGAELQRAAAFVLPYVDAVFFPEGKGHAYEGIWASEILERALA